MSSLFVRFQILRKSGGTSGTAYAMLAGLLAVGILASIDQVGGKVAQLLGLVTDEFNETVDNATLPTISDIADIYTVVGQVWGATEFTIGPAPGGDIANVSVSFASSDQAVVPDGNIQLGGTGTNRTIQLTTLAAGQTIITLTVQDGDKSAQDQFIVDVYAETKIMASDGAASDIFGYSIDAEGDRLVVAARGHDTGGLSDAGAVYVFDWDGNNWVETKLTASDGAAGDRFGTRVSLDGNRIAVGADSAGGQGAVYIYDWNGTSWDETKIVAADGAAGDFFGHWVDLDGDRLAVGAYGADVHGSNSGAAYIYDYSGGAWTQNVKLAPAGGAADDVFARSVAVSGNRFVGGSQRRDDNGTDSGAINIFKWNGSNWVESVIVSSDIEAGDFFGVAVDIDGDRVLASARDKDAGAGAAYIFDWDGSSWNETRLVPTVQSAGQNFGNNNVTLSGNSAFIGAHTYSEEATIGGTAYIFDLTGGQWQARQITSPNLNANDLFGIDVKESGGRLFIGAHGDDDQGSAAGAVYIYEN